MAKLAVELNGKMNRVLDQLSEAQRVPKTEVIRRAIALLKYAEDERRKGNKLAIADKDGRVIREIVA